MVACVCAAASTLVGRVFFRGSAGSGVSERIQIGVAEFGNAQPAGVRVGDRVVAGVGVAAELVGVGGLEDGVDLQESAGGGVVVTGAEQAESGGGVAGLVEELP